MKKVILLAIMALSAAFIISCSEDQKTELKFTNSFTATVTDIKWTDSTGTADATWSGDLVAGSTSAKQEVKVEVGKAEATVGGAPKQLEYIDSSSAPQQTKTLSKNEENTWVISNAATK